MIDIHCHLVYGVDDGSKSIEQTIEMLKEAKAVGFTDIILTPHYSNYFHVPAQEIQARIDEIKNRTTDLGINLYHGNEIYISTELMEDMKNNETVSLNNSKYVLFELTMDEKPFYVDDVIYSILDDGKIPVIAHPERYRFVQQDPNMLIDYIERGVLFQSNYGSILGRYGKEAKECVKKLLTHNMIHFLGSDNHKPNTVYVEMPESIEQLEKLLGKEYLYDLTTNNPRKILENERFDIDDPEEIKTKFWKFWER